MPNNLIPNNKNNEELRRLFSMSSYVAFHEITGLFIFLAKELLTLVYFSSLRLKHRCLVSYSWQNMRSSYLILDHKVTQYIYTMHFINYEFTFSWPSRISKNITLVDIIRFYHWNEVINLSKIHLLRFHGQRKKKNNILVSRMHLCPHWSFFHFLHATVFGDNHVNMNNDIYG